MDFSGVIPGHHASFSPDGRLIASKHQEKILVRNSESMEVEIAFKSEMELSKLRWSKNSGKLLALYAHDAQIIVHSITDEEWTARIKDRAKGIKFADWSPSGNEIISVSDHGLVLTVWSLATSNKFGLKFPKLDTKKRPLVAYCDKFLAYVERRECKDAIGIFEPRTWKLLSYFPVRTTDLSLIRFSPDGSQLAIAEHITTYKLFLYSVDGRCVREFSAYEDFLGIKSLSWSPDGTFISIGSYDEKIRVFNRLTSGLIATLDHKAEEINFDTIVFEEKQVEPEGSPLVDRSDKKEQSKYVLVEDHFSVEKLKVDPEKPNPPLGVGLMKWEEGARFFATRNDNMKTTLWIWDASKLSLTAVLKQKKGIIGFAWSPYVPGLSMGSVGATGEEDDEEEAESKEEDILEEEEESDPICAIYCGENKLYFWMVKGVSCAEIPSKSFRLLKVEWRSDGRSILLCDKEKYCVCYM